MSKHKTRAFDLVREAVEQTGKTDIFVITDWLENKVYNDLSRWRKGKRVFPSDVFGYLERLDICTTRDVQKLIMEV